MDTEVLKLKRALLVGDSGGTGTDWCLVGKDGERNYFSSPSYQPVHFSETFFQSMTAFWQTRKLDADTEIHFYGAGCSLQHNQEILKQHFGDLGFQHVSVESDLLGACRGLLNDSPGLLGILGTGSVLAAYDGNQVTQLLGGFGYLIGDEGSGYHFGKMLLHRYLNHAFSEDVMVSLQSRLGDRPEIMKNVYGAGGKLWISNLAAKIERLPAVEELHRENIAIFMDAYLKGDQEKNTLFCFSGSYAFHNAEILRNEVQRRGWMAAEIIDRPIGRITDYTIKATL